MKLGTSYFASRVLRHVREDMKELKQLGFQQIVHTFSENDQRFYHDQMKDIVAVTKDAGLEVYLGPWGVGRVFGGEAFSFFLETNFLDVAQVLSDGKPGGCACPSNPIFRKFMQQWVNDAAATGADYVFWDEPHFYLSHWLGGRPGTWGCRCPHCQKLYEQRNNAPMPEEEDDSVKEFKRWALRDFLAELCLYASKAGLRNALVVLPDVPPDQVEKTWEPMATMPELEVFGTDPYWVLANQSVETVGEYATALKKLCDRTGREAQLWIQGFKIPAGREDEVARAIELTANAGIKNIHVWGFEACHHLSWIRCGDSQKVWNTIVTGFQKAAELPVREPGPIV